MLHTLNKDMLVKLVETIQKEKDREIVRLSELLYDYTTVDKRRCQEKNCNAFSINGEEFILCQYIHICPACEAAYCEKHAKLGMACPTCNFSRF